MAVAVPAPLDVYPALVETGVLPALAALLDAYCVSLLLDAALDGTADIPGTDVTSDCERLDGTSLVNGNAVEGAKATEVSGADRLDADDTGGAV